MTSSDGDYTHSDLGLLGSEDHRWVKGIQRQQTTSDQQLSIVRSSTIACMILLAKCEISFHEAL